MISTNAQEIPQSHLLGTKLCPLSPLNLLQTHRKLEIRVWNVATENAHFHDRYDEHIHNKIMHIYTTIQAMQAY